MWIKGVIPISELRKRQAEVLAKLEEGPIILTQHGHGAAVLVSLAQWERLMERLEDMDDALTALEVRLTDTEPPVPLEEVLAELEQDEEAIV